MIPVIILGTRNTGSSAVLDYLRGRNDVFDPLGGQEFCIIQQRQGLSSLHRSLSVEIHPDDAMYAVIKFAQLAKRLGADSKKLRIPPKLGHGYSSRIPGYNAAISEFLKNITACSFGTYPLTDYLNFTTFDWLRIKGGRLPRSKNIVRNKPVPVPADEFLRCAQLLIARLFYQGHENQPELSALVFDQAGSFWSPLSSTQYFGENRRVIGVTRDPCDVYASLRSKKAISGSAEEFAQYQRALKAHIANAEWSDKRMLLVRYEDFVLDHERERDRICAHLGIDHVVPSTYDPKLSRKFVGRHKGYLTQQEIEVIRQI